MPDLDIDFKVNYTELKNARKELEKILKLTYQIEYMIKRSWLLRLIFGLKLLNTRKGKKNGKKEGNENGK